MDQYINGSGLSFPQNCGNLSVGFHGLMVQHDGNNIQTSLRPMKTNNGQKILCPTYSQAKIQDLSLLKKRISRIFQFLMYFRDGDLETGWNVVKKRCSNTLYQANLFNSLPSFVSEGVRLYVNKKGSKYPARTLFRVDFSGDEDCHSLEMRTMKQLSDLYEQMTNQAGKKGSSTKLVRAKRSPLDFLYGGSSEAEIIENVNINSANVKSLYDWSLNFQSGLETTFATQRDAYELMRENVSHLAIEAHAADLALDLAVNIIFTQLHGTRDTMELHTNLLNLERLEGNLLRAAGSLGRTVTGVSECRLGYGGASCSKGKPTVQIINSVLKISTIEEKVNLKQADKYACVPNRFGLSKREGATIIHQSSDGRLLLSNGEIVMTEPEEDEFAPVDKKSLPSIESCYFNSDFNGTYLVSCEKKTYLTLSRTNVVLEKFEVLAFKDEDFPLHLGHKKIGSADILNLINVFSGIRAAKQLTIKEDFSPISFGHLVEAIEDKSNSTAIWHLNLPELIQKYPAALHYVSVTAVFLSILAIILLLYVLRLIVSNWTNIRDFFVTACSCQWLWSWLGFDGTEDNTYIEVPTAPERELLNDENLRFNETVRNVDRLQARPPILRPRQPAFTSDMSSLDASETSNARERQDRKQREIEKAKKIISKYGLESAIGGPSAPGLDSSAGLTGEKSVKTS